MRQRHQGRVRRPGSANSLHHHARAWASTPKSARAATRRWVVPRSRRRARDFLKESSLMASDAEPRPAEPAFPFARLVRRSEAPRHGGAVSRALHELRPDGRRTAVGQADHRHRADRRRPHALQSHSPRHREARARRHPRRGRRADGISAASDLRELPPAHRRARSQSRLSRARRNPARLSHRRGGAHHRLRQDDARADHGGLDGRHSGHRAVRRPDARRLARRRSRRLRHGHLALAPQARGRDRSTKSSSSRRPRLPRLRSGTATRWARLRP